MNVRAEIRAYKDWASFVVTAQSWLPGPLRFRVRAVEEQQASIYDNFHVDGCCGTERNARCGQLLRATLVSNAWWSPAICRLSNLIPLFYPIFFHLLSSSSSLLLHHLSHTTPSRQTHSIYSIEGTMRKQQMPDRRINSTSNHCSHTRLLCHGSGGSSAILTGAETL